MSLTILAARIQKSNCWQVPNLSLKALGENPHLPLLVSGAPGCIGLWQHNFNLCLCLSMIFSLVSLCLQFFSPFSLIRIPVIGLGPTLTSKLSNLEIFLLNYICKDKSPKLSHIHRYHRLRTWTYLFQRQNSVCCRCFPSFFSQKFYFYHLNSPMASSLFHLSDC